METKARYELTLIGRASMYKHMQTLVFGYLHGVRQTPWHVKKQRIKVRNRFHWRIQIRPNWTSIALATIFILSVNYIRISAQNPNIYGGVPIEISEAPYQVSLELNGNHICGGAIIDEEWILTAGHCVVTLGTEIITVHAGATDQTNDLLGQRIEVDDVIIHPDFTPFDNWQMATHDLALLHLETPLIFNANVQPIEYVTNVPGPDPGLFIGFLTGWGDTGSGCCSDVLMGASLPLITDATANALLEIDNGCEPANDLDVTMMAFYEEGMAAGKGDSGGPAVMTLDCDHKVLVGIASWGGCPRPDFPSVYADVRQLSSFVEEIVSPHSHLACVDVEITTNTSWSAADIPSKRLGEVVVRSGSRLDIEEDVALEFCEDGILIIEANAEVRLYGKLTTTCGNDTWQGVKVYGNGEKSQYFDFTAGVYHHGTLNGYPGSLIENAVTGVELWGPEPEDTGGRIFCTETEFKNNAIGVSFLPYENFKGSQPHPYIARFKDCKFIVDDGFNLPVFYQHVSLYGVDGLRFTGCKFGNMSSSLDHDFQHEYGYGIFAVDAGFIISASTVAPENPEPCIPGSCTVQQRSVFKGLGYGIWTGSAESNRLFRVYQADFEDCYTGIEVEGVSGGVMLFNEFDMGTVPDPEIMNGDQVGIKLNQQLAGFTIEENTFTSSSGNTNNTIGISAENLGDMNTVIRKNTFSGLTLANEAFGINGSTGNELDGLRYLCNININTTDKDFFVKNSDYGTDNISTLQAGIESDGSSIATGNQFSSTGDQDDGDFANYGVQIAEYHYYPSSPVQVPDDIEGIGNIEEAQQNSCSQDYCAPPCLSSIDLADLSDEYFEYLAFYEDFTNESEWTKATASKTIMDRASLLMVQHYYVDSTAFHRDSLRAWYGRILTVSGDILLAKDYAAEGDYTTARQVLGNISTRFSLPTAVEDDIAVIDTIFGMLDARGLHGLTQGDIDDLVRSSENMGHSASMARSLLMLSGYRFETYYVLPDPDPEPFIWLPENPVAAFETVTVYPNPVSGDLINIKIPDHAEYKTIIIEISNIIGQRVAKWSLSEYYNTLKLPSGHDVLMYRITGDGQELKTGRIFSFR